MKRLLLLHLVGLLALAFDSSEASTLVRRQSSSGNLVTKKAIEETYICIDRSVPLPVCNFGEKASPKKRSVDQLERSMPIEHEISSQSPVTEGGQSRGVLIIYTFEGCVPYRLPFRHPECKEEDKEGRTVLVHKLRPFAPPRSIENAPLVFPEMNEQAALGRKEDISGLEKKFNKFLSPGNNAINVENEPRRFQPTRRGSEFPYDSAISYDAKKLEDRREKTKRDADKMSDERIGNPNLGREIFEQ